MLTRTRRGAPTLRFALALIVACSVTLVAAAQDGDGCLTVDPDSLYVALDSEQVAMRAVTLSNPCQYAVAWEAILLPPDETPPARTVLTLPPLTAERPEGSRPNPLPRREEPVVALVADLEGAVILYDRSHGQTTLSTFSTLVADLTARGAEVVENQMTITASVLEDVDVLWLNDSPISFTTNELNAIEAWCLNGGGLMLAGYGTACVNAFNDLLARLDAGITFSTANGYWGETFDVYEHPTTDMVNSIFFDYAYSTLPTVESPAVVLADDVTGGGVHIAAASEHGNHRIVALVDMYVMGNYSLGYGDNQVFANQCFDWLAERISWLRVAPTAGNLPPGMDMVVNLTFDASSRCTESMAADLWILADDPVTAPMRVANVLEVTGRTDIDLDTDAIAFGDVYVGAVVADTMAVINSGCDLLTVSDIQAGHADITVAPTSFAVAPGDSQAVIVQYQPSSEGPMFGTLVVVSDDLDEPAVMVLATGAALAPPEISVAPASIHSDLDPGGAAVHVVEVTNTGTASLDWRAVIQTADAPLPRAYTLSLPDPSAQPPRDEAAPADSGPVRTVPLARELSDLGEITVMFDVSHGQYGIYDYSTILDDLAARGATVVVNSQPVSSSALADIDIFWSTESFYSWAQNEIDALAAWTLDGGSLLLEGDGNTAVYAHNDILAAMDAGIEMSTSNGYSGYTGNIHPHDITQDIDQIYLPGPTARLSQVSDPAGNLVDDVIGDANTAFSECGLGRVIVIAEDLFLNGGVGYADNQAFANQCFDWLSNPIRWLILAPREGTVPPGATMYINATIDATDLCADDFTASVLIASNDPAMPNLSVAASISVSAQPDIDIDPAVLDLGEVLVGTTQVDTLLVHNSGCEPLSVTDIVSDHADVTVLPTSFTVGVDQTQPVSVAVSATQVGPITASLTFASNDPDETSLVVELFAEAILAPEISVTPGVLIADVPSGETVDRTITINNLGAGELDWSLRFTEPEAPSRQLYDLTPPPLAQSAPAVEARTAQLLDLTDIDVVFDAAHGQYDSYWSIIRNDLTLRGATVTTNTSPFTQGSLDSAEVLWITDGYDNWTTAEYETVVQWVRAGGNLLLEGDGTSGVYAFNDLLQALEAGITVSTSNGVSGLTDRIAIHATTHGVQQVNLPSPGAQLSSVYEPAEVLVEDVSGNPNAAHSLCGWGRVVVIAERAFEDYTLGSGDNQIFGNQIFDWLSVGGLWLTADPMGGTVAPGGAQDVTVTFDATLRCNGAFTADALFDSNDPMLPTYHVQTIMNVTGEPMIGARPDTLEFGTVFAGGAATDTLEVSNLGCATLHVTDIDGGHATVTAEPSTFELEIGQTQTVIVTFAPEVSGAVSGFLAVSSDAVDLPMLEVPWFGAGLTPPQIVVWPDTLASELSPGGSETRLMTVVNSGESDLIWSARIVTQNSPTPRIYDLEPPPAGAVSASNEPIPAERPAMRQGRLTTELLDLTGTVVVYDLAHGQASMSYRSQIIDDLTLRGATVQPNNSVVTPEMLGDVDLFWITDCYNNWTTDEIDALVTWVTGGGSLLLEGDDNNSVEVYNDLLTLVGAGIDFSTSNAYSGPTSAVYPHPTTDGIATIFLDYPQAHIDSVTDPAGRLFDDYAGTSVGAFSETGWGRVVAISEELFENYTIGIADNQLFANQVFDWLSDTTAWLRVEPSSGVVAPFSPDILNVEINAEKLCGAQATAEIVVFNNDPLDPEHAVATTLTVAVAPNLAELPATVDLGPVFLGAVVVDTLRLTNDGCAMLTVSEILCEHADIVIEPSTCSIPPAASETVLVTYTPGEVGPLATTVEVHSDDPDLPLHAFTLTSQVYPAPIAQVWPDTLDVPAVTGERVTRILQVSNSGGSDLLWELEVQPVDELLPRSFTLPRSTVTTSNSDEETRPPAGEAHVQPLVTELADLTGVSMLYDRSHGQSSPYDLYTMFDDLVTRGATIHESTATITAGVLAPYSVLWINESAADWTPAEVSAVVAWVESGGGLLLQGDNDSSATAFNTLLAALNGGIMVSSVNGGSGNTLGVYQHPTTTEVTEIYLPSPGASLATVSAPATRLIDDYEGIANTAASHAGFGRIIVSADEMFYDYPLNFVDNQLFANQVFDWLARASSWLAVVPQVGSVAPGNSVYVNVDFSAEGMCGGVVTADLVFSTNDPTNTTDAVPARLDVLGEPVIEVAPAALDFGNVFVGAILADTLTVANPGCYDLIVESITSSHGDLTVSPVDMTVPIGGAMPVVVTYAPSSVGALSADVSIVSDDPMHPLVTIPVNATALLAPVIAVNPDSIYIEVPGGAADSTFVTVENSGGSDLTWHSRIVTNNDHLQPATLSPPPPEAIEPDADAMAPAPLPAGARTQSLVTDLSDLTGISILFDQSHGQGSLVDWSTTVTDLTSRGAVVATNYSMITESVLAPHDVLWTIDVNFELTYEEQQAIANWVNDGNALLIEGDNGYSVSIYNELLAAIGAGITMLYGDSYDGTTTSIHEHQTTMDVEGVYLGSPLAYLSTVAEPAGILVDDLLMRPHTAYSRPSSGRVFVTCDEIFSDWMVGLADNQVFANQTFDWLAGATSWLIVEPTSGIVPPGGSAEVQFTFDATGICGEDRLAAVLFENDDPLNPSVRVGTHMHSAGLPTIEVAPMLLDFGVRFVGDVVVDSLYVTNDGCDVLEVASIASDAADLSAAPNTFSVPVAGTQSVAITYAPSAVGDLATDLVITSNAAQWPELSVPVSGAAVEPPVISVLPDSLYLEMPGGTIDTLTVVLANSGGSDLFWNSVEQAGDGPNQAMTLDLPTRGAESPDAPLESPPAIAPRELAVTARLADLTDAAILYDLGHGEDPLSMWSTIVNDLATRGAVVTATTRSLTADVLADHQVLWLTDHTIALDLAERRAIVNWVETGGSLLLEGDDHRALATFGDLLSDLEAGITLQSGNGTSGVTTTLHATSLDQDAEQIYLESPRAYLASLDAPARPIFDDRRGRPCAALSEVGGGRIVVLTDEVNADHAIAYADNQLMANRMFDWLIDDADWLRVVPMYGVLPAGEEIEVDVIFDATELCGGDHLAGLLFQSNDPITPQVRVGTHLHLLGEPVLAVAPTSLDIGGVYLGSTADAWLTVSNPGCDLLSVSDIACDHPAVSIDPGVFDLDIGGEMSVTVTITPTEVDTVDTVISITSNDPYAPLVTVPLTFTALEAPIIATDPDSLYCEIPVDQTIDRQLFLRNDGGSALNWTVNLYSDAMARRMEFTLPPAGPGEPPADLIDPPMSDPPQNPLRADLADLTGITIAFDRSHNQTDPLSWNVLIGDLTDRGATVEINTEPVTADVLSAYRVFWITEGDAMWSPDEVAVLVEWIRSGGRVMLEGDSGPTVDTFRLILALLNAGIDFLPDDGTAGVTQNIRPHETTVGVASMQLTLPTSSLLVNEGLATLLVSDVAGVAMAGCYSTGQSRVMAMSEDAFNDYSVALADNRLFANRVFDWLAAASWFDVSPVAGTVPAGEEVELTVTFRSLDLGPGQYLGELRFSSNDPGQPVLPLPVAMAVIAGEVGIDDVPVALDLRNAPNPFNPSTEIRFNLARASAVEIRIYDVRGTLVRRIDLGEMPAGPTNVRWQGRDERGAEVASGVYMYNLFLDRQRAGGTQKMTLLK